MSAPLASVVTRPQAWGYQARINDLYVRLVDIADGSYLVQTVDVDERSMRVIENPEDVSQTTGLLFSRSDFSGGEGLGFAHKRDNDERSVSRFWSSSGVDVKLNDAGELSTVSLLPKVASVLALTTATAATGIAVNGAGDRLFVAAGENVQHSTDLASWTSQNPLGAGTTAVLALTALGPEIYAGYAANGIYKRDAGGTWASWSDLNVDGLWTAKDRVIAASGTGLYQAGSLATSTLLHTLPDGYVWNDVSEAGRDIVAVASNGRMYFFTIAADLSIALAAQVTTPDEIPTCVTAVHDTMFWGTEQRVGDGLVGRWWRATLAPTTSTFTGALVIREWSYPSLFASGSPDPSEDLAPRTIFATRDAVFIGVGNGSLWRYDLRNGSRQAHLYFADAGLPRHLVQFRGRMVFAASTASTAAIYAESTTEYVESGYLIGPMGDLFTAEKKTWVEATLEVAEFGGGTVELSYATDPTALLTPTAGWSRALQHSEGSSLATTTLANVNSRYIAGKLNLRRGSDVAQTPSVNSFSFRAYPFKADLIVQLPVLISDHIQLPGRRITRARGLGLALYRRLATFESGFVELELLDTDEVFRGRMRQVTHIKETTDRHGHRQLMSMVTFVGRRSLLSTTTSEGALGLSELGIATFGGVSGDE